MNDIDTEFRDRIAGIIRGVENGYGTADDATSVVMDEAQSWRQQRAEAEAWDANAAFDRTNAAFNQAWTEVRKAQRAELRDAQQQEEAA